MESEREKRKLVNMKIGEENMRNTDFLSQSLSGKKKPHELVSKLVNFFIFDAAVL